MLSDREAEEIERGRREKVGGPVVLKWIDQLLADRRARVRQAAYLRKRLAQAFRYLDGLVRDGQSPAAAYRKPPTCPRCQKPYVRAAGDSPRGIVFMHDDGGECRT